MSESSATHSGTCGTCQVGVTGDLETVSSWAVVHAFLGDVAQLNAAVAELARHSRAVVVEVNSAHEVTVRRIVVDPRPAGHKLTRG